MAIHVLMTRGFEFHHGLFYWAQTRLGSLVPWLASFVWKQNVDPLMAYSIAQYGLVMLGIVLFRIMFPKNAAFILASLFLLFPPQGSHFMLMPGHPYLPHFVLTVAAMLILERINFRASILSITLWVLLVCVAGLSLWVSDLTLVTVSVMLLWKVYAVRRNLRPLLSGVILSGMIIGFMFLLGSHLKEGRVDYSGYQMNLSDVDVILAQVKIQANNVIRAIAQVMDGVWTWVHTAMLAGLIVFTIAFRLRHLKRSIPKTERSRFQLFLILAISCWGATLFSGWAAENGYPQRYFAESRMFVMLGLMCYLFSLDRRGKVSIPLFASLAVVGALSFTDHRTVGKKFEVETQARKRLTDMRNATIIGDYWYSYAMAAYNANEIIALPLNGQFTRNGQHIQPGFRVDSIFVCSDPNDMSFPDTLVHYEGYIIVPTDESKFKVGNAYLKRYNLISGGKNRQ